MSKVYLIFKCNCFYFYYLSTICKLYFEKNKNKNY